MERKFLFRSFLPILIVFLVINSLLLTGGSLAVRWNINSQVMIISNLILFIATAISFYFYYQALNNNKVHAFLRSIYGAMFIKMLICLFAAFLYILSAGKSVNKGAILASMFLYFLYTFVEIAIIMKLSKQRHA